MSSQATSTKSNTSPQARRSGLGYLSCLGLKSSSGTGRIKSTIKPATTQIINKIYWRNNLLDNCDIQVDRQIRSEVLAMIHNCYDQVKLRLVVDAGFCFGLLDPASCIILNTVIAATLPKDTIPESDAAPDPWECLGKDRIGDMDERSLRGLVAFLTCLFPYLTDSKATKYLHMSKADPLIAAQLILIDRGYDKSFWNAATIDTAMLCAATAGQHPNPQQCMRGWKLLMTSMNEIAGILSADHPSLQIIIKLLLDRPLVSDLSDRDISEDFDLPELVASLVASRSIKLKHEMAFPGRDTMRRMLLTMIHGFYLQALAMLPKYELCSSLHYCMLQAGHCYGTLDPVSNIILNTICYHSTLSSSKKQVPEINMLSTRGLLRIGVRSFYGLVSFMCTRHNNITPDAALRFLQETFESGGMISDLKLHGGLTTDDINILEAAAYDAAAHAAHHPCPNAQKQFFSSSNAIGLKAAADWLGQRAGHTLSSEDVLFLSNLVSDSFPIGRQEHTTATKLDTWSFARLCRDQDNFWERHERVVEMVKSALNKYCIKHKAQNYELHLICGVNEHVNGLWDSSKAIIEHGYYIPENKYMYQSSHINFLATCVDSSAPPVLFFAECSNDSANEESSFCCVVRKPPRYADQIRCFYCECSGSRIVHPSMSFHGSDAEFVEVIGRGRLFASECSNDTIISRSSAISHWMYDLEDDSIYCTAVIDKEEDESSDNMSARAHLLDNL